MLVIELLLHILLESADRFVTLVVLLIARRADNHLLILQLPIVARLHISNLNGRPRLLYLVLFDAVLLRVASLVTAQIDLLVFVINLVVLNELLDDFAHIVLICQLLQKSRNPIELYVTHIIVPTCTRNGVLGLEQECNGRVVHDDYVCHVSAQTRQILDECIVEVGTMLAEQLVATIAVRVELGA